MAASLWPVESSTVVDNGCIHADSTGELGRPLLMLTPHSIWWHNNTRSVLAWGSRCAAAWGPYPGNASDSSPINPPAAAVVYNASSGDSEIEEVLLEFDAEYNTTLRAGGAGSPPLADVRLGSDGLTIAAVLEPAPFVPGTELLVRTVVALGDTSGSEADGSTVYEPVARMGVWWDDAGQMHVMCTAWPLPEVAAAATDDSSFSVSALVNSSEPRVNAACILDPRLLGAAPLTLDSLCCLPPSRLDGPGLLCHLHFLWHHRLSVCYAISLAACALPV